MEKTLLLFLSASSKQARQPDEEQDVPFVEAYKDINEKIQEAKYRECFELAPAHKVSLEELMKILEEKNPQIVHFFGHGEKGSLLLENESGNIEEAKLNTFAEIFKLLNKREHISPEKKMRCVVLVACNSKRIAAAIAEYVDCAIGMTHEIPADIGRKFAKDFYYYLGNGNSVKWAFDYACNSICIDEKDPKRPALMGKEGINLEKMYFVPNKFAKFSGRWEGVHLSKNSSGARILSRHHYDLEVAPNGDIRGTCHEASGNPPYTYGVKGKAKSDFLFFSGEIQTTDTPSYTWLFNPYNENLIPGFTFSKDFEGSEFASYIIMSRNITSDADYFKSLEKAKKRFYLSLK